MMTCLLSLGPHQANRIAPLAGTNKLTASQLGLVCGPGKDLQGGEKFSHRATNLRSGLRNVVHGTNWTTNRQPAVAGQ
jgi:hypothetical protein